MYISSQTSIISANFQRLSKVLKNFCRFAAIMPILQKVFKKKSPSRCISSCQQEIKLDQFSQQNTHCRTAILQNSSLGAPSKTNQIYTQGMRSFEQYDEICKYFAEGKEKRKHLTPDW